MGPAISPDCFAGPSNGPSRRRRRRGPRRARAGPRLDLVEVPRIDTARGPVIDVEAGPGVYGCNDLGRDRLLT